MDSNIDRPSKKEKSAEVAEINWLLPGEAVDNHSTIRYSLLMANICLRFNAIW